MHQETTLKQDLGPKISHLNLAWKRSLENLVVKKSRLIPNWLQLLMASLLAKPPLNGGALLSLHALLFAFKNLFSRFTWISRVQAKCDHSERVGDCSKEGSNKKLQEELQTQRFTWLFSVADGDQPPPELICSTTTTGSNEHARSFIASLIRASWQSSKQAEELHAGEQLLYILRLLFITAVLVCRRQRREVAGRWM